MPRWASRSASGSCVRALPSEPGEKRTTGQGPSPAGCIQKPALRPWPAKLGQDGDRSALGLEHRLGHVAEILSVGLKREGRVAAHLDPVEVVAAERVAARP